MGKRVEVCFPRVRYSSMGESEFDASMQWCAGLTMWNADDGQSKVLVGHLRFLSMRLWEDPVADMLDSLSADDAMFLDLFDGEDVNDEIVEQFSGISFSNVLVLECAEVAEPLRGNNLGAWLAAEVVSRMACGPGTLVAGYPHPFGDPFGGRTEKQAVAKLRRHWRQAGLVPLKGASHLFGGTTDLPALSRARRKIGSAVEDLRVRIDPNHPDLIHIPAGQTW